MPRDSRIKAAIGLSGTSLLVLAVFYPLCTRAGALRRVAARLLYRCQHRRRFQFRPQSFLGVAYDRKSQFDCLRPRRHHLFSTRRDLARDAGAAPGAAPGRPVTFTAYGNGPAPIISGSDIVKGWSLSNGSIYRARSSKPNNVYVDGGPGWGLARACCLPSESCAQSGSCAKGPMTAGSWYWNPATSDLYVWLEDGSNPANTLSKRPCASTG